MGQENERKLATSSLEVEDLHRKSHCEMLISEGDISNVVISLGTCLSMLVYIRARFRFALIVGNLKAQAMINKDVRVIPSRDVIFSHTMEYALNFVHSQDCIKKNPVGKNSDHILSCSFCQLLKIYKLD